MAYAVTAGFTKLESANVIQLHLGGSLPCLFNADELPKRTAVYYITQSKNMGSKV